MEKERQELSDAVSLYYGNDYLKFVIVLNPFEIDLSKLVQREFIVRGLKLHEFKRLIQKNDEGNHEAGLCVVDDMILYICLNMLVIKLMSINGIGITNKIFLDENEYDQLKFMVNRLAK